MKAYAAPLWVKNGIGQEVIQIDQHGGDHDQPRPFPFFAEEHPGDQAGKKEVEGVVEKRLKNAE